MRRGQVPAAFAISVIAVLWTSVPAMAKGPSQGVITGPGLVSPISLRESGDAKSIGPDLASVAEESGFFLGVWGGDPDHLRHRPAGDLGPRYTITYSMPLSERRSDTIVQYVFPYAEPKPITYMPAKQVFWGDNETVGTWYVARIGFRETLIGLGLPASAPSQPAAGISPPTVATVQAGFDPTPILIGTAILALVLAAILMRRTLVARSVRSS
jgi:hypothetical protein